MIALNVIKDGFGMFLTKTPILVVFSYMTAFFLIDIASTYFFLKRYKQEFPEHPWENNEHNPIVKFFLKKYGLQKGVVISAFATYPLVIGMMFLASMSQFFFGMIFGTYIMLFRVHMITWTNLFNAVKKKKEKSIKKQVIE